MTSGAASSGASVAAALERACDSGAMLSGAVGLIIGGRITTVATAGVEHPGGPPTGTSTRFGLGPITGLLTAIAVARSEVVSFDHGVADSVPTSAFDDGAALESVRIADVLGHTSGLPYLRRDEGPGDEAALERFVSDDLAHHRFQGQPGELALYSPSPYALVGRALEVANGRQFDEIIEKAVLGPVGMGSTGYPGGADLDAGMTDDRSQHPSGFLLASIEDMLQLAKALVEGWLVDGATWGRIGSQHASRDVSHVGYPLTVIGSGYGLGCQIGSWNGRPVVRQAGRQGSDQCSFELLTESGSAVALLTRGATDSSFNEILSLAYGAVAGGGRLPTEPGLKPTTDSQRTSWVGTFVHRARGSMVTIEEIEGDLVYRSGEVVAPVYHLGEGRALVPMSYGSAPMWFPESDSTAPYVKIWGEPYFRQEIAAQALDARHVGIFRDSFYPNPATDIEVRAARDVWTFTRGGVTATGTVIGEGQVATGHGVVEFTEDGSGLQVGGAALYFRS